MVRTALLARSIADYAMPNVKAVQVPTLATALLACPMHLVMPMATVSAILSGLEPTVATALAIAELVILNVWDALVLPLLIVSNVFQTLAVICTANAFVIHTGEMMTVHLS